MKMFSNKIGTRIYNFGAATLTTVGSSSSGAIQIGTLNELREVMLRATTDCVVKFGGSDVSVAASDAAVLSLSAGERFHLRLRATETHYAVIQESAGGNLRVTPVA